MRNRKVQFLAGLLGLTLVAAAKSPFTGTWEGKINRLPGIDIRIEDTGGKISGETVFYFQLRDAAGKWRVAGQHSAPMLAPVAEDGSLSFEVIHYKAHGSSERGPNVKFRLQLTGANEAVLQRLGDAPVLQKHAPEELKLTRR